MANCHELFLNYHEELRIGRNKKDRMINSKNALRTRIRKWFADNHSDYEPKFFIQGSHKMKTGIRTKDDICDLDDGIYFFRKPDVTATTLQGWVWTAVNGYTDTPAEHRKKCIRSLFAGDYEIDHPIYYKVDGTEYQIAVKDKGFESSDPKGVVDWYNKVKDKEGRLTRQVMYLKGWCDHKRNKMPSGLAMTILAANAKDKIVFNYREDITLKDLLKEIKKALSIKFSCVVPAAPYDDLFTEYDEKRKQNFFAALDDFIADADKALREENELKASRYWQKHLGNRFPDGADKTQQSTTGAAKAAAIGAATSKPWGNA